jgi:hypothetical protein
MGGSGTWRAFVAWASDAAVRRGGSAVDRGDCLLLTPSLDGAVITVTDFDRDAILVETGWFIRFAHDIAPEHMSVIARHLIEAIMDGGATEYLSVEAGIATAAGQRIEHASGVLGAPESVTPPAVRVSRPVPRWAADSCQ